MNIERLDSSRILISLGDKELFEQFHTSFEGLEKSTVQGSGLLGKIICETEIITGIDLSDKKLKIEAARYNSGCIFLITFGSRSKGRIYYLKERSDTFIFSFDSIEQLLSCINVIKAEGISVKKSRLVLTDNIYYLIIPGIFRSGRLFGIIMEYCSFFSQGRYRAAAVSERGILIGGNNAVGKLLSISDH